MHPGVPWPGPEAVALSLARLAGGGALMSDTCATAEKTKRLLSDMIKEQATEMAREKMGDAWDGLSGPRRRSTSCASTCSTATSTCGTST